MFAISIRLKILAIVLGFFTLVAIIFVVYSVATTANYRQLRTEEVSKTVAFEAERVGRVIAEMERNAVDLALVGRQYYLSGRHTSELGVSASVENFSAFTAAVGGGIWYEPYALDSGKRRVCYYAFFDAEAGGVRYDPDFETEQYDYHSQMWYKTISSGIQGPYGVAWTPPYIDDAGTNALMTTVGAGIYDEKGRLVGISTVDWQIQSMVDRLSSIKPTQGSFVLVASPKDDYIISNTHTHESLSGLTGKSLSNLPWYSELPIADYDTVNIGRFVDGGVEYISFSRMFANGWLFSVDIPSFEIFAEIESLSRRFTIIIAASFLVLLLLASWLLSQLINRPLHKLTTGVAELGAGNLDKQIDLATKDEIGSLAAAFNKMTIDLKTSIEQNVRERAEKERIGAELKIATQIQAGMLPCIFPPFPDRGEFDLYAMMIPAKEVGGDFYDFFLIGENTLAVVIADVSGKGVPAALFMVIAKTLIKNNAQSGKSPKEVFETVNNMLCENNSARMFVSAFLGYLDVFTGRFTFVNAGHNPPLLNSSGTLSLLKVRPRMVLAGMKDMSYEQHEATLQPGDELFLYTDGITEAVNQKLKLFGDTRLLETVNNCLDLPLRERVVSIKREIDRFAEGAEQADDITILALRYKGLEKNDND